MAFKRWVYNGELETFLFKDVDICKLYIIKRGRLNIKKTYIDYRFDWSSVYWAS